MHIVCHGMSDPRLIIGTGAGRPDSTSLVKERITRFSYFQKNNLSLILILRSILEYYFQFCDLISQEGIFLRQGGGEL